MKGKEESETPTAPPSPPRSRKRVHQRQVAFNQLKRLFVDATSPLTRVTFTHNLVSNHRAKFF